MSAVTQAAIEAEYAERIAAASAAEIRRRDAAFIDVPFLVAGAELIRPMCLPDYLVLIEAGNAHVCGLTPAPAATTAQVEQFWALHNAQFMWVLSPEFSRAPGALDAYLKRTGRLSFLRVCEDLGEYLRDTFADAPRPAVTVGGAPQASPLRFSFAAVWYHRLGARLHWSRSEIRATPLRELFQLLRAIDVFEAFERGKRVTPLGDEVDRLWGEMLARINALHTATP